MLLYCVRHGESLYNAEGRIQGQSDVSLSPLGLRQADALAEALATHSVGAVFSSPLARAAQTARPIAATHSLEIRFDDRLKEINAGIFQGLLWSEIREKFPHEAEYWLAQEPDFVIPQGESRRELMDRGVQVLESIRETGMDSVVVVSHGGLLTAAFKRLLEIPAERRAFSLLNASISQIRWTDQFRLLTLNETSHLDGVQGSYQLSGGDLAM